MEIGTIGFLGAFAAGVLSFISPCVFPLTPAYLDQLIGMSFDEMQHSQDPDKRRVLITNAFAFVIDLAFVFALLGASASLLGRFYVRYQTIIERIAGLVIIIFGLHLLMLSASPG